MPPLCENPRLFSASTFELLAGKPGFTPTSPTKTRHVCVTVGGAHSAQRAAHSPRTRMSSRSKSGSHDGDDLLQLPDPDRPRREEIHADANAARAAPRRTVRLQRIERGVERDVREANEEEHRHAQEQRGGDLLQRAVGETNHAQTRARREQPEHERRLGICRSATVPAHSMSRSQRRLAVIDVRDHAEVADTGPRVGHPVRTRVPGRPSHVPGEATVVPAARRRCRRVRAAGGRVPARA
jgi:hypothetical protein